MKITMQSTSRIVQVHTPQGDVPARIWEGVTESGIECQCMVTRVLVSKQENCAKFEVELIEHRPPSPVSEAIPLRFIL